jgi:hypothetical protein
MKTTGSVAGGFLGKLKSHLIMVAFFVHRELLMSLLEMKRFVQPSRM